MNALDNFIYRDYVVRATAPIRHGTRRCRPTLPVRRISMYVRCSAGHHVVFELDNRGVAGIYALNLKTGDKTSSGFAIQWGRWTCV